MKFQYTIHSIGTDVELASGEVTALTPARACLLLEKDFKNEVLENGALLHVSLLRDGECVYNQRYESRHDFRRARLSEFSRKMQKRPNAASVMPCYYFVAMKRDKTLVLTKLAYDLLKPAWLTRRKRKLLGPFKNEQEAQELVETVEQAKFARVRLTLVGGSVPMKKPVTKLFKRTTTLDAA